MQDVAKSNEQRGVVLVVLIPALTLLMVALAFGFDLANISQTREVLKDALQKTALSSLKQFFAVTPPNGSPVSENLYRLDKARAEAENATLAILTENNVNFSLTGPMVPNFGTNISGPGTTGIIIPGVWHFAEPEVCYVGANSCPCDPGGGTPVWKGPCFEEIDLSNPADPTNPPSPNALKVKMNTPTSVEIRSYFAGLFDFSGVGFESHVIVAQPPIWGMMLVDLSRSSHIETHIPAERSLDDDSTESAWKLNTPGGETCADFCSSAPTGCCQLPFACRLDGGRTNGLYDMIFNMERFDFPGTNQPVLRGANPVDPKVHYHDDYVCVDVTYDDGANGNFTEAYLVDAYYNDVSTPEYFGPQPLTAMLDGGVNFTIERLQEINILGDLLGFIGFDQSVDISKRIIELKPPGDPALDRLKQLTSSTRTGPGADADFLEKIQDNMLFVRADASSHIAAALLKAADMMINAPSGVTDSSVLRKDIVLISDGLATCSLATGVCDGTEATFDTAMVEIENIINTVYIPLDLRLNVILIGEETLPHSLLEATPNGCQSDAEFRATTPPGTLFVDPTTTATLEEAQTDDTKTFPKPNSLYEFVRKTGGIWAPIRDACAGSDLTSTFNEKCSSGSVSDLVSAGYVDADNRVLCDIQGRSMEDQIQHAMQQIFGNNRSLFFD